MKYPTSVKVCAVALLLALSAQTTAPALAQQVAPTAQAQTEGVVIPDGTEITVISTEEISSKTAVEGDPLTFKIDEDVTVNGKVVIAKGTIVKGEVANAKKSGRMGKGGALSIRIHSTQTVDDQKIKLRASKGREGDDKTGTTVALVVLFGPLGFLKKGKDAKIKEGTRIKAYTDEEKRVAVK
jgi:DNA-directed RNA polymerase subunit E'/Rpb7